MKILDIFQLLNQAQVRYVVVGGVAVVLQGIPRFTQDLDLVVSLTTENVEILINTLQAAGFKPLVPVNMNQFKNKEAREYWLHEKNMLVFQVYDTANPLRQIDIFTHEPFDFEEMWQASRIKEINHVAIRIASIPHLIAMKRKADRPQDREDIRKLLLIDQLRSREQQDE